MRRKRTNRFIIFSFDTFLDVICNLTGFLILLTIIFLIKTHANTYNIFSPVFRYLDEQSSIHYFSITPEGIKPLDLHIAIKKGYEKIFTPTQEAKKIIKTKFYNYYFDNKNDRIIIEPISHQSPLINYNNAQTIVNIVTETQNSIGSNDDFIAFFFVSPDNKAFKLYRLVRKYLWQNRIKVGWSALDPRNKIVFANKGFIPGYQ